MRYLLLTIMMVLLPLRGWMGNAMAADMAAQQIVAAVAQQAKGGAEAAMPADCPMMAALVTDAGADQVAAGSGPGPGLGCHGCDTCQLCLALAPFALSDVPAPPPSTQTGPAALSFRFISAERTTGFKPPIS